MHTCIGLLLYNRELFASVMDTPNSPDPRAGDGAIPTPLSRNENSSGNATASRVGDFVAQRNAEKDKAFSYVLSWAGRLFAGGTLWYMLLLALYSFGVIPEWILACMLIPPGLAWAAACILLSTLPVDTWDFDATLDSLPAVRRMFTIGAFVLFGQRALAFPYIPGGLGACACLVKFVWDELDSGCCARRPKDTTISSGCCGGGRPRITTIFCICWVVLGGLHDGAHNVFEEVPCHAGGGAVRNSTAQATANTTNTTTAMCPFAYVFFVTCALNATHGCVSGRWACVCVRFPCAWEGEGGRSL